MKSARFHHEIHWISWIVDFSSEPIQIYSITWSTTECCIFHQNQSPWHEICQISWNSPDFMKFTWFHEICQISPWNLPDFMNSGFFFRTNTDIQYYMVYHWMLYFSSEPKSLAWNPPNFMKSAKFHTWNLLDFMKSKWAKDQWSYFLVEFRRHLSSLLDYITPIEIFQIRIEKKRDGEIYRDIQQFSKLG